MKWDNITVQQFQQLMKLRSESEGQEPFFVLAETVEICFRLTRNQVDSLSTVEFNELIKELDFVKEVPEWKPVHHVTIDGRRYRFVYDVRQIHAARNVEVKYFSQGDFIQNIHKMAASMVIPQRRNILRRWVDVEYDASQHEQYAKDLLQAPIGSVYGNAVFFLRSLQEFDSGYNGLFDIEPSDDGDEGAGPPIASSFMRDYGWQYNATAIAELERITLNEAWELPYIQFLNGLAYLKSYNHHMKEISGIK